MVKKCGGFRGRLVVEGRCSDFKEGGEKGEDEDELNETIKEKVLK